VVLASSNPAWEQFGLAAGLAVRIIRADKSAINVPFKPLAVANRFIELGNETGKKLTVMKLLGIVYFAHGWHLALTEGAPLIDDKFEAWRVGPVAPTVYRLFKEYNSEPITKPGLEADIRRLDSGMDLKVFVEKNITELLTPVLEPNDFVQKFIQKIWEIYGPMSDVQLSQLACQAGTPWHTIWNEQGGSRQAGTVIPDSLIASYFKGNVDPKSGAMRFPPADSWGTTLGSPS
jgi:uncharacterized phage-associated protein